MNRPDSIVKIPLGKLVSVDKYRVYKEASDERQTVVWVLFIIRP